MSSITAALIVIAVIGTGLVGGYWQIRRAMGTPSEREEIVRKAHAHTSEIVAEIDALELTWSLPAYDGTRNEQHEEGQP